MLVVIYIEPESNPISTQSLAFPPNVDLLTVYKDFLSYLLAHTRRHLRDTTGRDPWPGPGEEAAHIVLPHPNGWGEVQQRFLRDAAVAAGLVSQDKAKTNIHFVEEAEASISYFLNTRTATTEQLSVSLIFYCYDVMIPAEGRHRRRGQNFSFATPADQPRTWLRMKSRPSSLLDFRSKNWVYHLVRRLGIITTFFTCLKPSPSRRCGRRWCPCRHSFEIVPHHRFVSRCRE